MSDIKALNKEHMKLRIKVMLYFYPKSSIYRKLTNIGFITTRKTVKKYITEVEPKELNEMVK